MSERERPCPVCGGAGRRYEVLDPYNEKGSEVGWVTCAQCGGRGIVRPPAYDGWNWDRRKR